ncbi:MAG TPA: FG-GAP-like repeat-containing protein [Candidatus Angelobacter sp.]
MNLRALSFSQRTLLTMLLFGGTLLSAQEMSADAATAKAPITFSTEFAGGDFDLSASSLVVGDFNRDGRLDVAALESSDITEFATVPATVLINLGVPTQEPSASYTVGLGADEILTADFNHDGNLDLAVANAGTNTVSILLGNGDGTFRPANDIIIGGHPKAIAAADFTRDGFADLAVIDCIPNVKCNLLIYRGNASGNLTIWQQIGLPGAPNMAKGLMVTADFNIDGRPDLALVAGNTRAMIFTDNASGKLQLRSQFTLPNGSVAGSMAWGSFNHDILPDLVFRVVDICGSSCSFANSAYVFLNTGSGAFVLRDRIGVHQGAGASLIAVTDVDGDNIQDFVTLSQDHSNAFVQYSLNHGDGKFDPPVTVFRLPFRPFDPNPSGGFVQPTGLIARDVNFDSRHDIGESSLDIGTEEAGWQIVTNDNARTNCPPPDSSRLRARICSPAANATVGATLTVTGSGNSPAGVKRMELWVDGKKRFEEWNDQLFATISLTRGRHQIIVQAIDQDDSFMPTPIFVTVP